MRYFEVDGPSPVEILNQFLAQQKVPREYVEMEIIDPGSKGILGIGRKPAKVKLKFNDYEYMKRKAKLYLSEILNKAGFEDYHIEVKDLHPDCVMNIRSSDAAALTGRSAVVLDSLQYLVDRVTRIDGGGSARILVDVDDYRKRVIEPLKEKAIKLAHSVKKTGRPAKMQPMATIVRREIHVAAKSVAGVTTISNGDGQIKSLTILADKKGRGPKAGSDKGSYNKGGAGFKGGNKKAPNKKRSEDD